MRYICAGCGWARDFDDEASPMLMVEEVSKHVFDDHVIFDSHADGGAIATFSVRPLAVNDISTAMDLSFGHEIVSPMARCRSCGNVVEWTVGHGVVSGWGLRHVLECPSCGEKVPDFEFGSYSNHGKEG